VQTRLEASVLAMCQPWFYLRLVAYGLVGLSAEHTVARETGRCRLPQSV